MSDLFSHHSEQRRAAVAPLADRLRPRRLEEFVGQQSILGPGRLLHRAISADRVGNLILHGPPGTGKTTLARIIAATTRAHFTSLNAVLAGVKDLRLAVEEARARLERHGLRTLLFIDEVHRFNSAQQDALLPWVENGTVTLIGATTENPYFEVNKALVSRSRLFRLQPLESGDLEALLQRALTDVERGYGGRAIRLLPEAAAHLVDVAGGDARSLLNALELAVETTEPDRHGTVTIDLAIAEESIQQRAVLYDKQGDAHFDTISAFIKSLRGSDPDAALFWLARMVEAGENPRFLFRRMLISAGEDVGLADPMAIVVVEACAAAFERIGLPEGLYPLAQAALYLAGTEKSNSTLGVFDAIKVVRTANRQQVPAHLRDANRDGQAFGDGVGYRYPHAYAEHWVAQQYLPVALQGEVFWQPGAVGWEGQRRQRLQERRAAQLGAAAELTEEAGELLTSSPEDPRLERWLQRQASAEGARLDQLRQRFWKDACLKRTDRVLVLEARSLLWALDPLQRVPEGGVVIGPATDDDRERIQSHLALLDSLQRPRLLGAGPAGLGAASGLLHKEERFEWIVARQPLRHIGASGWSTWLQQLDQLAAPAAEIRLLFSAPMIGPASALRCLRTSMAKPKPSAARGGVGSEVLARLETREQEWLRQELAAEGWALAGLGQRGWECNSEAWEESLPLPLTPSLLERWFAPGSAYCRWLQEQGEGEALALLLQDLKGLPNAVLPQRLEHRLLLARRTGA
ncbi:AAA family ATPase [Synechococcus sp. CCY9201]|uniref:AAA family ATPase n=1 Tax=unclassified Synechococcus TaxID=2626047 RepID=UPI0018CE504A|nr:MULTISPECIES: AAA family ATPase [unclassified Synechococcus]MEA5472881.1 AAA family ATPase [Synechococcus sp. CCY9201]QPN68011.1 AAA family ATPase [Synechococcus sp. CBW1006]